MRNELTIECCVRGRPKIAWFKDGHTISNNRYRFTEDVGGVRRLIIRHPVPNDFGRITCRAEGETQIDEISMRVNEQSCRVHSCENGSSDCQHKLRLSKKHSIDEDYSLSDLSESSSSHRIPRRYVEDGIYKDSKKRPVFSTHLMDRTAAENSAIKLTCNIMGIDNEIEWLRNGSPMQSSPRYRVQFRDGLATLEFFAVMADDSAEYTCVARNEHGESSTSSNLKVYQGY